MQAQGNACCQEQHQQKGNASLFALFQLQMFLGKIVSQNTSYKVYFYLYQHYSYI